MEERAIVRLLSTGRSHLEHGSTSAAIESFRSALSIDPTHAEAHAWLAIALHDARRLHAAEIEAGRAITEAPESAFSHLALGVVLTSQRRWGEAKKHLAAATAFAHDDASVARTAASMLRTMNERAEARAEATRALDLAPDEASSHVIFAQLARDDGDRATAQLHVGQALALDPGSKEALVLQGWLHLDAGEVQLALDHAHFALREDPNDDAALRLLVGAKMRRSPLMGLWWRFNTWAVGGTHRRTIVALVTLYLVKQLTVLVAHDLGLELLGDLVSYAWLAFCVYTWVGPAMFRRALDAELDDVRLRDDF